MPSFHQIAGLAVFSVALCAVALTSVAMADGIGGGGSGGGGGGHQTIYGWGWRLYTVSGSGPNDGFRNGTSWSTVRNACQGSSAQIAVFVINDSNRPATQMGYDYHQWWYEPSPYGTYLGRYSGYKGNSGSPWMNMSAAEKGFNALSPAIRSGYDFGRNVSWYCYGTLPQWTTSGTSSVNASIVSPGTKVKWTHRAKNDGPVKTNKAIRASVIRTGFGPASYVATGSSAGVAVGGTVASASKIYTTTLADGGNTLCENLRWSPNSFSSAAAENSLPKCVKVRYGGNVSQQLLFDPADAVVDDSTQIDMKFDASNTTGDPQAVNFDGYVWYDRNYDGVFNAGETKIFTKGGTGVLPRSPTTTNVTNYTETVDLAKGGRICGFWNVSATSPLVTNLDGPDVRCTYIGFTPKLQAWGSDIRVGSSLLQGNNVASLMKAHASTIKSGASTTYTGTWSEYGLFAPYDPDVSTPASSIIDVASSAWPADGSPSATPNQVNWSNLTFGNKFSITGNPVTASCLYGCFASPDDVGLLPNVEKYLSQHGLAGSPKVTVVAAGAGPYNINSDIVSDGSGVPRIIIADNIIIRETVTNIDAWLIARNSINTCSKPAGPIDLKLGECKQTLRVNGPIIAKTFIARRLGDVQADKKSVGEVVNLRGDEYIWAYKTTHNGTAYKTTGVKELPPRY